MKFKINYNIKMLEAMKFLVRDILKDTQEKGLQGEHHFYITFYTNYEKVVISDWLKEEYPSEMTIVIQNWFENLIVYDDFFSITLNFNNEPEKMNIPFSSLKSFADPFAEFYVSLENKKEIKGEIHNDKNNLKNENNEEKVIKLDSFRKN
tara:strand:- start:647 stop:1096 length:450 start_codon:yes stop_codon:yes gene_type:complete